MRLLRVFAALLLFAVLGPTGSAQVALPLRVHFIDVGQGDAVLRRVPLVTTYSTMVANTRHECVSTLLLWRWRE